MEIPKVLFASPKNLWAPNFVNFIVILKPFSSNILLDLLIAFKKSFPSSQVPKLVHDFFMGRFFFVFVWEFLEG